MQKCSKRIMLTATPQALLPEVEDHFYVSALKQMLLS